MALKPEEGGDPRECQSKTNTACGLGMLRRAWAVVSTRASLTQHLPQNGVCVCVLPVLLLVEGHFLTSFADI